MWGKTMGKVIDVCLATSLISMSAAIVAKTVSLIRKELNGGKENGRD